MFKNICQFDICIHFDQDPDSLEQYRETIKRINDLKIGKILEKTIKDILKDMDLEVEVKQAY